MPATTGRFYGVGVGPGDPELVTVKALRLLQSADIVAYFAKAGRPSNARAIVAGYIRPGQDELPMLYPVTTECPVEHPGYSGPIARFYEETAARLAEHLTAGRTIAVACEGDPFFYGSFMHLHRRLADRFPTEVVPGITGMSGCWTNAGTPITWGDDVLTVLPATLDDATLTRRLAETDAAVVMKLGRNLAKVRRAMEAAGVAERAVYVEHGTRKAERIVRLRDKPDDEAPYFSAILVPGRGRRL